MSFLSFAGALLQGQENLTVLFVVGDDSAVASGDSSIKTHIENRGYTVTYIDDDDLIGTESGYGCILISDSVNSNTISNKLKDSELPILNLEYLSLTANCLSSSVSTDSNETEWELIDDSHPIASGFSNGDITIFSSASLVRHTTSTSNLGSGADVIFNSPDGVNRPSVFVYESGAALVGGDTTNSRRVYMPFEHSNWAIFTDDAKDIFDNALDWALGIE